MNLITEIRATFRYDSRTGFLWWKERGLGRRFSKPAGSKSARGYISVEFQGKTYKAHNLIWAIRKGVWPAKQIDHKNTFKYDNRWCNLREASQSENRANSKMYANNTSGYKGVTRRKGYARWRAMLQKEGKRIRLGAFGCPKKAHAVYVKAAKKHFGEFARAG